MIWMIVRENAIDHRHDLVNLDHDVAEARNHINKRKVVYCLVSFRCKVKIAARWKINALPLLTFLDLLGSRDEIQSL